MGGPQATLNMLKLIEPYVTWGIPNIKTVKELLYKRGFAKVALLPLSLSLEQARLRPPQINKQRLPISDNVLIEKHLGHCNVLCLEDMVHEIFTVGEHFRCVCVCVCACVVRVRGRREAL
jgi:hypothetical protein